MRLLVLLFLVFYFPFVGNSQIQDDFSDGDFTNNPVWSGDDAQFKINSSKKVQLKSTGSDTSYLSTPNALLNNTEWRFYIKQSFNSSANNHSRIYLISNQANLKSNLNGYFVQFGSAQDDICLYRQDGNSVNKIISGISGNTGNSVNEFTIKVTRDINGNWELFSDASAANNFQSEGTATDLTYTNTSYFGLWCKYTSSNSTRVYFDDVYVGAIIVDTIPPKFQAIRVLNQHDIDLYFDENLDPNAANLNTNYSANNGLGTPSTAVLDAVNHSVVHLSFSNSFVQAQQNTLTVSNLADLAGNIMNSQQKDFVFYEVQAFDIVFNEVMADPSPKVGLPQWEYIELYNTTNIPISLKNWTLTIGSSTKILPDSIINPKGFMLIAHQNASSDLSPFGSFIGLGSFSLTNSGQQLILKNDKANLIHQINYNSQWYADKNKAEGGWSLEQIDPENPCGCSSNWRASTSSTGGSPGAINAVNKANPDQTKPELKRVVLIDSATIRVYFTEIMDSSTVVDTSMYFVNNYGNPIKVKPIYPDYRSVYLSFSKAFQKKTLYILELKITNSSQLNDCVGNSINSSSTMKFGIPESPDTNDVVINEILFNPQSPGVDYVELYNRSDKIIDLSNLRLANWNDYDQNYEHIKELSSDGYLFFPEQYLVICTDPQIVRKQYLVKNPNFMIQVPSMISLPNSQGNVLLISASFKLVDRVDYDEDMHYKLLQNTKGISLERLNYNWPSNDRKNWHSAAQTTSGSYQSNDFAGTPTSQNSQFTNSTQFDGEFGLEKDIFSPDNDGFDDVLTINYKFDTPGYTANIRIYNSKGQLVSNLVNNELLSTEGYFIWDGLNNENQKVDIGIYIVYIEVFNLDGSVKHFKLKTVVAGHLDGGF